MQKRAGWLDRYTYDESIELLKEFATVHAKKSGRFQDSLISLLASDNFLGLLDFAVDYRDTDSPMHLYHARQALAFFQKLEPLKVVSAQERELAAFRAFAKTEVSCAKVNARFRNYRFGTPFMGYPWDVILTDAREKIGKILGKAPTLEQLDFTFGPGATVSTKKKESCFRVKLGTPPECSKELAPFAGLLLGEMVPYAKLHTKYVWGFNDDGTLDSGSNLIDVYVVRGKLQFVPKDARKLRTIIVEPSLNVLFQQGIGKAIRKRLKRAGIDLSDQGRNKYLAKLGSMDGYLATVDFSSASDTIAKELVAFLLPEDWWVLMSLARTGTVEYNNLPIELEKFSTMGNSFTFELESLIFWAIAWACLRHLQLPNKDLSIFGDDLIIPGAAMSLCECAFAFCGFTVNSAKSFAQGPFRESCGGDFFKGIDIRPYYQKDLVSPESLFVLHNYYMRNFEFDLADSVRSKIHPDLIIFGPDGYGDGHLIGAWNPGRQTVKVQTVDANGRRKTKRVFPTDLGWSGSFFSSYRHVSPMILVPHTGDELLPAYSIYARSGATQDNRTTCSPQGPAWLDPMYLTVPGSIGYEKASIYTQRQGIFL